MRIFKVSFFAAAVLMASAACDEYSDMGVKYDEYCKQSSIPTTRNPTPNVCIESADGPVAQVQAGASTDAFYDDSDRTNQRKSHLCPLFFPSSPPV